MVSHLAEKVDGCLAELVRIDDTLPWAVAQLSTRSATDALLQARYLRAATTAATTTTTSTTSSDSVVHAARKTPTPSPGLAHRQWFPPGPGDAPRSTPTIKAVAPPKPTQPSSAKPMLAQVAQTFTTAKAVVANGTADAREQTEQLKEMVMLHYLKKQRALLDTVEAQYSVTITSFSENNAGFVCVSGHANADLNAAWLAIDAALVKAPRKLFTFLNFQDPVVRACFKRKLQGLHAFSPSTAVHVDIEAGTHVGPVVVHLMASDDVEMNKLDKELTCTRTRIVLAPPLQLAPEAAAGLNLQKLERDFGVVAAVDPITHHLKVAGYQKSNKECLAHVAELIGDQGAKTANTKPAPPAVPVSTASSSPPGPNSTAPKQPQPQPPLDGVKSAATKALRLSPRPEGMTTGELGMLVRVELGVEPTFIVLRDGSAYVRYRPTDSDNCALTPTKQTIVRRDCSDLPVRVLSCSSSYCLLNSRNG